MAHKHLKIIIMKDIIIANWGTNQIALTNIRGEYKPVEIHLKEDGTKDNTPSFAIVMEKPKPLGITDRIFGQVSLKMLNEALNELGYEIIKT
jgi:hypothetical protein